MGKVKEMLINDMQSEVEAKEGFSYRETSIGEIKAERRSRIKSPEVKNIDGKPLILKAFIEKITPITSRHGYSWRVKAGAVNYYFNSNNENGIYKMLEEGKMAVFTVKETPNRKDPSNPYLIVQHVFYTF